MQIFMPTFTTGDETHPGKRSKTKSTTKSETSNNQIQKASNKAIIVRFKKLMEKHTSVADDEDILADPLNKFYKQNLEKV